MPHRATLASGQKVRCAGSQTRGGVHDKPPAGGGAAAPCGSSLRSRCPACSLACCAPAMELADARAQCTARARAHPEPAGCAPGCYADRRRDGDAGRGRPPRVRCPGHAPQTSASSEGGWVLGSRWRRAPRWWAGRRRPTRSRATTSTTLLPGSASVERGGYWLGRAGLGRGRAPAAAEEVQPPAAVARQRLRLLGSPVAEHAAGRELAARWARAGGACPRGGGRRCWPRRPRPRPAGPASSGRGPSRDALPAPTPGWSTRRASVRHDRPRAWVRPPPVTVSQLGCARRSLPPPPRRRGSVPSTRNARAASAPPPWQSCCPLPKECGSARQRGSARPSYRRHSQSGGW